MPHYSKITCANNAMKPLEQSQARDLYAQGYSRQEIATRLGASRSAVNDWTSDMRQPLKTCPICNKQFLPKRTNSVYCSRDCKIQRDNQVRKPTLPPTRQCPECETSFQPTNAKHIYCSSPCRSKTWHKEKYQTRSKS